MGIFIPNIDIPECCALCLRFNGAFNYCYEIKKHIQKPWERYAKCPLIEITNEVVTEWLNQCANVKKGEKKCGEKTEKNINALGELGKNA